MGALRELFKESHQIGTVIVDVPLDVPTEITGVRQKGGPSSGNYGHGGRPGQVGGSAPSAAAVLASEQQMKFRADLASVGVKPHQVDGIMGGINEFVRDVTERIGETGWTLTAWPGAKVHIKVNAGNGAHFVFDVNPLDPENGFFVSYVNIPRSAREKGMGMQMVDNWKTMAKNSGFKSVTFDATSNLEGNLVGAYVWAKMPGVKFASDADRVKVLADYADYLPLKYHNLDRDTAEPGDIVNTKHGKSFLLGNVEYGARIDV